MMTLLIFSEIYKMDISLSFFIITFLAVMRVEFLKIELYQIVQVYGSCLIRYLANISFTCILSSGRPAVYRIPLLIPYLYFSFLLRLTNTSMASCRCVQFNSTGIFQSPDFPKVPLSFLSSSMLPPSSTMLFQHPFLCLLYKFIAPDGYIIEVTFDYFHLSPRINR